MVLCTGKKEENVLPGSAKSYKGRNYQVVLLGVNVCGAECKVVFFFIFCRVVCSRLPYTHHYVYHLNTWCTVHLQSSTVHIPTVLNRCTLSHFGLQQCTGTHT